MNDDKKYYVQCPRRKNSARLSIVICLNCEFVTGSIEEGYVGIGCGFPNRRRHPKIKRPKVKKISRDGVF